MFRRERRHNRSPNADVISEAVQQDHGWAGSNIDIVNSRAKHSDEFPDCRNRLVFRCRSCYSRYLLPRRLLRTESQGHRQNNAWAKKTHCGDSSVRAGLANRFERQKEAIVVTIRYSLAQLARPSSKSIRSGMVTMSVRSAMPCLRFASSKFGVAKSRQPNFEANPFQTTKSP